MSKEEHSKSFLGKFAMVLLIVIVGYNMYSGLTVRKIGIPGILEIEFGEKDSHHQENPRYKEDSGHRRPRDFDRDRREPPESHIDRGSQSSETLAGDEIQHFRVLELTKKFVVIEVDYTYNHAHGQIVYIGARFLNKGKPFGGYIPTRVPEFERGTAVLKLTSGERQESDELLIFLHEPAKAPFVNRVFHFAHMWE